MPDILIALETEEEWDAFCDAVHRGERAWLTCVLGATWRKNGEVWPEIAPGERVYVVWGTIVRGYAPLVAWRTPEQYGHGAPGSRTPDAQVRLDLSRFVPEGESSRFRDEFRRSWRYHRPAGGTQPKYDGARWEWAGAQQREAQVAYLTHHQHDRSPRR